MDKKAAKEDNKYQRGIKAKRISKMQLWIKQYGSQAVGGSLDSLRLFKASIAIFSPSSAQACFAVFGGNWRGTL